MNASMKTSKDTFLTSALIVVSLAMAMLGPLLNSPVAQAAVTVSPTADAAQSVWTPAAMQPILHREAAIIVTAPRINAGA